MKKLAMLISVCCFVFVSCNNQPAQAPEESTEHKCEGHKKCCKELTEEQKADMEAWKNWDSQTTEKKEELVAKRKECIDNRMAKKQEKCDAEKKEECPAKAAKCAEMKAQFENWDNLTLDEKKALLDEMPCCGKKQCCKGGNKKGCEKKCEGKE